MPVQMILFQIALIVPNLILFAFLGYYLLRMWLKEQELLRKEGKIDSNYHQVVDNALTKERKILEDAVDEADHIIAGAQYVNNESKEIVKDALQKMVVDIQKEAMDSAQNFTNSYQTTLKQLSLQSIEDFQNVTKNLKLDLQKELAEFHEKLLPKVEKELDEYKQARIAQTDKIVTQIIQIAAQELLNKTISLDDHQKLVRESLERAKKEGAFD